MSEMSYLEKLLDGVEVEWKTLGQTCKIETGKLNANAAVDDGEYMFFTTAKETSKIDKFRWDTEALLIAGNANVGEVKHYIGKFEAYQRTYVLTNFDENVSVRFLYFVLSHSLKKYLEERTNSAAMTYIVLSTLENFPIPIPCPDNPEKSLAIQSEIVRILDKFTALTAELTAELNMRKKQYNYYRDQLLSFKEGEVNWTTLGNEELFHICAGGTPSKSKAEYWDNGSIPWLKSESCNNKPVYFSKDFISELGLKKSTAKLLPKNTTLIALVGATIFKTAFLEFEATTNQNIASIKSTKENIIADKFIFYFLTNLYNTLKSEMRNYGMLNLTNLRQFRIPIPCIAEQKRIVSILDKFDALTNSITEGLPREIELRQKQYEYYRDLLFSFPKPETVSN